MERTRKFQDIDPDVRIGEGADIASFVTIESDVTIGKNVWIGPNVVIMSGTRIGDNCKIFPGAVLGAIPQDLKFEGEKTELIIGDNVTIREYCTLNRGTKAEGKTQIGNHCLLMAYVHIAHDCIIGNHCILANNTTLAGHIHIGDYAILGGMTAVHQFVHIGQQAMIGGGSLVRKDVPPFIKVAREPLSYVGVNSIGLKRRKFDRETIHHIEDIYRILFLREQNKNKAIALIEENVKESPIRKEVLDFIQRDGQRGLIRGYRSLRNAGKVEELIKP